MLIKTTAPVLIPENRSISFDASFIVKYKNFPAGFACFSSQLTAEIFIGWWAKHRCHSTDDLEIIEVKD